jgi:hypothetical protein
MNYGPHIVSEHPHLGQDESLPVGSVAVDPTLLFGGLAAFAVAMLLVGRPKPKPKRRKKLHVRSPFQSPFYLD